MIHKADGVFLWTRLALNDLFKGILAKDPISMLESRLDQLNSSLNGLFEQLLGRLEPVHRASAANYLRFERDWFSSDWANRQHLTVLHFAFGCEPELGKRVQDLFLNEQAGSTTEETVDCIVQRLNDLQISLNARCAGLLEVTNTSESHLWRRNQYPWLHEIRNRPHTWSLAEQCYLLQVRT